MAERAICGRLNTSMTPVQNEPVKLTHRLVVNYFTAKRLLGALQMAVQQHEKATAFCRYS
jgi:hypothetical protein